jgi:hypothetical protein
MSDAEIGWPRRGLFLPARVDVVDLLVVDEVSPVNGKLIIRVELALEREFCRPRIWAITLEDEHAVVDGRLLRR